MVSLRLRELRATKKMTQAEVATHLQIARESYSRYETGEREMNYDTIISLADFFAVSVDYLLGRYDANPMVLYKDEETLVKKYRIIDERGQKAIMATVEHEYTQSKGGVKKSAM
jgi:transcriptional regulator with XRE-family HTH domain